MICFMCSFAQGRYCYCRPGWPVIVRSQADMLIINTTCPPEAVKRLRRSHSDPGFQSEPTNFIRFRSLRDTNRNRKLPPQVSMVSITSSTTSPSRTSKWGWRQRAQKRIQAQWSSSSSSVSVAMVSAEPRVPPPPSPSEDSNESREAMSETFQVAVPGRSPSYQALLIKEETSSIRMPIAIEGLEQGIDPFADPFEEEERRSRTEQWVESTSPGPPLAEPWNIESSSVIWEPLDLGVSVDLDGEEWNQPSTSWSPKAPNGVTPTEHDMIPDVVPAVVPEVVIERVLAEKINNIAYPGHERIQEKGNMSNNRIPTVTIDECPEHSTHTENTTTSTTGEDEEREDRSDMRDRPEKLAGILERTDSLQTEELMGDEISVVSSEVDKNSLTKQKFRQNLDQATSNCEDIHLEDIDKFWLYRYKKTPSPDDIEQQALDLNRCRGHTPTVERVVMFYTQDKRPLTPRSSPTPSFNWSRQTGCPSPLPSLSPSPRFSVISPLPNSLSPSPLMLSADSAHFVYNQIKKKEEEKLSEIVPEKPQTGHSMVEEESDILEFMSANSSDSSESLLVWSEKAHMAEKRSNGYFHLEARDADDNSESEVSGAGFVTSFGGWTSKEQNTSAGINGRRSEDLVTSSEIRRRNVGEERSTGSFEDMAAPRITHQSASTDDDVDVLIWNGRRLEDVETSSVEDLLALETRPNSTERKSVTFSDRVEIEIISPQRMRKATHPMPVGAKPILKKEDKQTHAMRQVLEYAGERLHKDLQMLVEERDRAIEAIEMQPTHNPELSPNAATYQMRYRDQLLENKAALDKRIDEVWGKLKELPLDTARANFVFGVGESSELTMHRRRVLPRRNTEHHFQLEKKSRNEMEMASEYSRRMASVRSQLIRRDSDMGKEDDRSIQEILHRVSRTLSRISGQS